jgi:sulfonate transport system substrate-binding protein
MESAAQQLGLIPVRDLPDVVLPAANVQDAHKAACSALIETFRKLLHFMPNPAAASIPRRWWLSLVMPMVAAISLGFSAPAQAQSKPEVLRIGFQKAASLLVLQKAQGTLEKRLARLGVDVRWIEFPAGPQMLEGLNVGAIDVGYVGEAPPVFAQAAGASFVYVGNDPASPRAEAVVVPKDSPLKSVADLKGKKVALNKGSNVHYLLVRALEQAGLKFSDVQPVYLAPADARAAFDRGAVDAWAIWDPFLAAAEKQGSARILVDGRGLVNNYLYYLAERSYAEKHPEVLRELFEDSVAQGRWLKANVAQAAALIAPLQGLSVDVVELSLNHYEVGVAPVTPTVAADQQKIADTFHELKLIPKAIRISDALPSGITTAGQ